MPLAVGIDLGTSSTKTVVIDQDGNLVASASANYPLETPQPGWVEQDPDAWWRAICSTTKEIAVQLAEGSSSLSVKDIGGISLSGHMNGAVFVDHEGSPLRRPILWLDRRSQQVCDSANEIAGDLLATKTFHVLNPINTLAKILWVKAFEPDCYQSAKSCLVPKDWIRLKMTGEYASEVSDASVSAMLDLSTRDWCGDILDLLEVRQDLLPPVLESSDIAGRLSAKAAGEMGLFEGIPVCAGGGDVATLAVGSGVIKPGVVNVGIGTAGHAIAFAETIDETPVNQLWPMCHCVPGAYFFLGCSYTCGASMSWLSDQLGEDFGTLSKQAEKAPPGSEGLFFMPWMEGSATPHPDTNARAGWIGLTLRHNRGHLVRSLMEGVSYDLRQSLECFAKLELPLSELRIGEGGARSVLWRQIQADVFGRDVRILEVEDASALGAAIIAAVGVEIFPDFDTACNETVALGETVHNDTERTRIYDTGFEDYRRLYPELKDWFYATGAHQSSTEET
jgi:xylulokinase